jgi:hypothetical protein
MSDDFENATRENSTSGNPPGEGPAGERGEWEMGRPEDRQMERSAAAPQAAILGLPRSARSSRRCIRRCRS